LKHIEEVGSHTCNPTDYARRLEAENEKLKADMAETGAILGKLVEANGNLAKLLASTSDVLGKVATALKGKGYG
jgi:ABC-type transporter Mla subunit MlaD